MKKILAFLLCLLLTLPYAASAATRQAVLTVNDAVRTLDLHDDTLTLTAPDGTCNHVFFQDGRLYYTEGENLHAMYELVFGMNTHDRRTVELINSTVEYLMTDEASEELTLLFSMLKSRLPALNDYIGWQQKDGNVLETQHTFSSMLTILSHFVVNELMDSGMISRLNESALSDLWKEFADRFCPNYSFFPLGIAAYFYLRQLPLNSYSSYLPEEPVTVRLNLNENQQVCKIEAAFSIAEAGMHLEFSAALSADDLSAGLLITYDDEPGVKNSADLHIWPQNGKWMADFSLSLPSEKDSMHLWGSAAFTEKGPDVLLLCDLPGEWTNISFRLTENKLYFTSLNARGNGDFSLYCDWTDEDYCASLDFSGGSYIVQGTYSMTETPETMRHITASAYQQTFDIYENGSLLCSGTYSAEYRTTKKPSETNGIKLISYTETCRHALEGKAYNFAAASRAAAQSNDETPEIPSALIQLLEILSGEKMQSEYDFCLEYNYNDSF